MHDLYVEDDRAAVYVEDTVLVLSPLATALVLRLTAGAASLDELTAHLVERFGAPPGTRPEEAVEQQLAELEAAKAIRAVPSAPGV